MSKSDLRQEVDFGLENLRRVYDTVEFIKSVDANSTVANSALTYECFGYYNAVEHMILRFVKHLRLSPPGGAFSHRDTFRVLDKLLGEYEIDFDEDLPGVILELIAFRHVATKIYGFLIDEEKLYVIVEKIEQSHIKVDNLFRALQTAVLAGE